MLYYDIDDTLSKIVEEISIKTDPINISNNQTLLLHEDYILLSTFHAHKPNDYTYRQIRQIRALGHQCVIGLLTFEEEVTLIPKLDACQGLQIFRLPLTITGLEQQICSAVTQIPLEEIDIAIKISQNAYIDTNVRLLKHGKQLELLNQSLIPLRAMAVQVLLQPNLLGKLQNLQHNIYQKLSQKMAIMELLSVMLATPLNSNEPSMSTFAHDFLQLLNANSLLDIKSYIQKIDNTIILFDKIQLHYSV